MWHCAKMGNDFQGLVIDDETGENIAVIYKKENAPLIASAPELLETCNLLIANLRAVLTRPNNAETAKTARIALNKSEHVIFKAEGK